MSTTVPPPNSSVPVAINKNAPQPSTLVHHDNPDQRMAYEAQHQANLMSEVSPLPRELLSEVESQKGKVPLAGGEHVDIQNVEAQHAPQVGHVMKEPNGLEKMGDAIKHTVQSSRSSSSSSSSSSSTTSTSTSIHPRDNIPHSALPNDTLNEIQSAKGSVPHAHHVDINKVEQQHQPAGLGHVQKEPNVLDKMGAALKNLTGSRTSSSSSSSASTTSASSSDILPPHDNIPHSALPDDALKEIHKAGGKVPHAHHVDITKVEEKAQPQGLGHVEKEKNILQRATEFLTQSVPPKRPDVPRSSLSTEVLKEITAAKGSVPHAHHIDVEQVEKAHQVEPLGHVVENNKESYISSSSNKDDKPGLMQKIKDTFTSHSSSSSSSFSSTGKDSAQHAAVSDAVLNDIKKADIHNLHHVNVTDVEQRSALTNDMGHVVSEPVSSTKTAITTTTTTTTAPVARFVPGSNVNPSR